MAQILLFQECEGWSDTEWHSYLSSKYDFHTLQDNKSNKYSLLKKLSLSISDGLSRNAIRWACIYLRTWGDSGLRDGKFLGIWRPLKYDSNTIDKIAKTLRKLQTLELNLSHSSNDLLESILHFVQCAKLVKIDETRICTFFRDNPEIFASLVKAMEERFLLEWSPKIIPSLALRGGDLTMEEIASIISYFVVRLAEHGFLSLRSFRATRMDHHTVKKHFDTLHPIYKFYCLESEVFHGLAQFSKPFNNQWAITRHHRGLARARSFGYYQTESLIHSRNRAWEKYLTPCPSLVDWFLLHYSAMSSLPNSPFFQFMPETEALRIAIPEPLLAKIGSDLLGHPGLFREEQLDLMNAGYEAHVSPEELSSLALAKNFTVMSLIRCNRIVRFMAILKMQRLVELSGQSRTRYDNSIITVMNKTVLAQVLRQCGVPDHESGPYLALLRWEAIRSPTFLDLQYSPIINIETVDLFLAATFSFSNLIRNAMMLNHKRMYDDGSRDPLVQTLRSAFHAQSATTKPGINYNFLGRQGDIDLLVQWDRHVFIFEAKNTLLPCSTGEMRTMYDYLDKAATQLDKHLELFKDHRFVELIKQKSGIDISQCDHIVPCIVLNVRLASGVNYNTYPIRHGWEIANFINDGAIKLELLGQNCVLDQWQGQGHSSPELLAEFLSENAKVYDAIWRSFDVAIETIKGSSWQVTTENYTFDALALARNLRQIIPVASEPNPTLA